MRVLVVGSRGMLGTDLVGALEPLGEAAGLDLPELDITIPEQCRSAIAELRPAVVLNAAALTDVDYCESHSQEAFRINAEGAGNLARAAAHAGAHFVHYSTDYVFDGRSPEAFREEDNPAPLSVYGRSKLRGEELVRSLCPEGLILRTSWLFGPHGRNFIRTIVSAARRGRRLRVVDDQRGSPSYTRDLAAYTRRLVECQCQGIYHVTNAGSCTWYELALNVLTWAGLEGTEVEAVTTAEFPRPAPRPANSVLAGARLQKEGFPPLRHWTAAAEEYVRTFL